MMTEIDSAPASDTPLVPPDFRVRTQALFAASRRKAVILRRGPKRCFQLIAWDLTTDRVERGQWMRGIVRLCDLSPSGEKVLTFVMQYHRSHARRQPAARGPFDPLGAPPIIRRGRKVPRYMRQAPSGVGGPARENHGTWTAISNVPYFTALAIWPAFGTWTGGGVFLSERTLCLHESACGMTPLVNVRLPTDMRLRSTSEASLPTPLTMSASMPIYEPGEADETLWLSLLTGGMRDLDWIYRESGGDLLFAGDGRLYRLGGTWEALPAQERLGRSRIIADLNGDRFRAVPPSPAALVW